MHTKFPLSQRFRAVYYLLGGLLRSCDNFYNRPRNKLSKTHCMLLSYEMNPLITFTAMIGYLGKIQLASNNNLLCFMEKLKYMHYNNILSLQSVSRPRRCKVTWVINVESIFSTVRRIICIMLVINYKQKKELVQSEIFIVIIILLITGIICNIKIFLGNSKINQVWYLPQILQDSA